MSKQNQELTTRIITVGTEISVFYNTITYHHHDHPIHPTSPSHFSP